MNNAQNAPTLQDAIDDPVLLPAALENALGIVRDERRAVVVDVVAERE